MVRIIPLLGGVRGGSLGREISVNISQITDLPTPKSFDWAHDEVSDHIKAVTKYLGDGVLDYVIVNNNIPRKDILDKYQKEGAAVVLMDEGVYSLNVNVKKADLVEDLNRKRVLLWEKQDMLRHDPDKLADSICRVYANLPLLSIS